MLLQLGKIKVSHVQYTNVVAEISFIASCLYASNPSSTNSGGVTNSSKYMQTVTVTATVQLPYLLLISTINMSKCF